MHAANMNQSTILIAGGAGYIGSYVNKLLNVNGYNTIVLDNLSRGSKEAVKYGKLIIGDIGDQVLLDQIFSEHQIDAVIHLAAHLNVGESVEHPDKYYENNVVKTLTLLNSMRANKVNRFLFSSSAAIFGSPETDIINEEFSKNPINPYGMTKLIVENILSDYKTAYNFESCSLRYFNAAGGDPDGEVPIYLNNPQNLIPILLNAQTKATIFGTDYPTPDGTCVRDYIHIHDLATAHLLALQKLLEGTASLHYNLGNGKGHSVLEVIDCVEKVTGQPMQRINAPRRAGDPAILLCDPTLAIKELGWKQERPALQTIVEDAWKAVAKKSSV